MSPSIKQIRYICAVAEYKHFSKAAEACFVTQSTLSAAIQDLESQLGVIIFERSKKSVLITPSGEKLLDQARKILGELEDFVSLAKMNQDALTGDIRLGVIPTIGPFILPGLLKELRESYPKLGLYLKEDLSAKLYRHLQQGELDLIILAFPYSLPEMDIVRLFKDEFLLCLPEGHQLEKSKQIKQSQLQGQSLLLLEEGHCLRDHALEACKLEKADTNLVYQGTSLHTLVHMVANGLGVTLLPQIAVDADVLGDTKLQLRKFTNENVSREIGLAWRKSDPRRDEYFLLADFIRENVEKLQGH
ncbi:MAG: LysR family transcriptional regulator [Gammaproteobacteria bacterium]|nr:LysR family transcriptional regulator [Gammaproteobacteria bacterium]|tara:strand:- start:1275 stop:2183 length:909 start_codon:yes stop_codon:yes gene_type:complete